MATQQCNMSPYFLRSLLARRMVKTTRSAFLENAMNWPEPA